MGEQRAGTRAQTVYGEKNIIFPFKATVTDPLSGVVLAKSVDTFDIDLPASSTRLLYIVPE